MKIYLVGPITGLNYAAAMSIFENRAARLIEMGYEVYHPMLGKEYLRTETVLKAGGYNNPMSTDHAIYESDKWKVVQADIVWADLMLAEKASIGACYEMAWADFLHKNVIVTMQEDNVHQHAFVKESATYIFDNHEDAYICLDAFSRGRGRI